MNLVGLNNENEFYTSHYLNEVFEGDIKDRIEEWQQKAQEDERYIPPHKQLRALAGDYFVMLDQLRKTALTTLDRLEYYRSFIRRLLEALGYRYVPHSQDTDEGGYSCTLGYCEAKRRAAFVDRGGIQRRASRYTGNSASE